MAGQQDAKAYSYNYLSKHYFVFIEAIICKILVERYSIKISLLNSVHTQIFSYFTLIYILVNVS